MQYFMAPFRNTVQTDPQHIFGTQIVFPYLLDGGKRIRKWNELTNMLKR